MRECHIYWTSL